MVKISKKGKKAWVTFTVPAMECENVNLKGDWNDWEDEPMKKKKNGEFYARKVLSAGETYRFGYEVDGNKWMCEETLSTEPSPFGSENSVLSL